jgi:chromosome segregation ATPase
MLILLKYDFKLDMGINMATKSTTLITDSDVPETKDNLISLQDSGKESQVLEINKQMSALKGSISTLTKKINTTNKQVKEDVSRLTTSDVEITESNEKQVIEINDQITAVEGSISTLTKKLNATNKQVKSDVNRLTTSDAEITDKVADTYKQLAVIDNTFGELSQQSNKITVDLKKVNTTLKAFEKSSKEALNLAIDTQSEVNSEFTQQHEDLIQRAEKLSKNAKTISTKLTKSIKENSKALSELEAKIITDLENVAQLSQSRDEKLDDKIKTSNDEISSQKAKMLLMQSVDEALEKRASALEGTSDQLVIDSQNLRDSTETLDILTSKLSSDVQALELHTAQLAQENIEQQAQIDELQVNTGSITRTLLALATLEKKHFRVLAGGSLLLVLAVIATFFYGEYVRDTEMANEGQRNTVINEQVSNLQNKVEDEQMASQVFYSEIIELQNNLTQVKSELQQKTEQLNTEFQQKAEEIKAEIVEMNDEVQSLDGRVQYLAPLYNFGSDNTIHGSQWLSNLDESKLSIKIATVAEKQDMYKIAQRYSNYFTEELAYFITADEQYALVYGGNFNDEQQVTDTLRNMPSYINYELISSISNAEILQQIKE